MDYTDLKEITETIIGIIQEAMDDTGNWPGLKAVPELLKDNTQGIGFYLFHVQENSHNKNYPPTGRDTPPVKYTPMALNLFYQLSPNWKEAGIENAYEEQRLMSVAMKAMHDHAIITKTLPAPPDLIEKKVNLKLTLQTLSPSESVQYWAAAESPVRLSAYYEVAVVYLQPEVSKLHTGRVLTYGNYIFVNGVPQITSSQSIIEYFWPGDPLPRQLKIQPAQVPPANASPAPGSEINFFGTGFNGDLVQLLILHPRWEEPAVWPVNSITDNQLRVEAMETATLLSTGINVAVLPGLYAAQISLTRKITLSNGLVKDFKHVSNQFPFTVIPRIDNPLPILPFAGTEYRITGYVFEHIDPFPVDKETPAVPLAPFFLEISDIEVYISEHRLIRVARTEALSDGRFHILDRNNLQLKLPAALTPNDVLPLRILVSGAESKPNWIKVP